jgi:hypothetical protein
VATFANGLAAVNAGANIAGGLIKGFAGRRDNRWFQNALIEVVERARKGDEWARTMLQQTLDPASQAALSGINLAGNQLWQGDRLSQENADFSSSIPGLFQQRPFGTPGTEAARARMEPLADNSAARGDLAFERFLNGGQTPEYSQVFDALQNYLRGAGSNSQIEQQNVGANLLGQRGQTAFTQGVQDRGMDALNQGGLNPYLEFALGEAAKQINAGGLTPESSQAIQMALSLLQTGGENENTQQAQSEGLRKALQNTVLPLNELRNITGSAATSQLKNSLRDLYANAARRGGGPGVTIANGLNSTELSDYLERAADVRGKAEGQAASAWMDAAQKDAGLGASLFNTGGNQALSRFGQSADLFNAVNNNAASRMNTAFGAIPGTQNSATNIMQTLGQLGLGALGAENQRMGVGAGLANDFNSGLNAFNNTFLNGAGNMNNFALGMGGLSNQFTNTGLNANNSIFGNDINAGQLNLGYGTGQAGAQNTAMNNRNNLFGQFSQNYNNGINQMLGIGGQYNDYARANLPLTGAYSSYGGGMNRQGFNLTGS